MKYLAVFFIKGTNTFVKLVVENHDDDKETIEKHVEGFSTDLDFIYLQDIEDEPKADEKVDDIGERIRSWYRAYSLFPRPTGLEQLAWEIIQDQQKVIQEAQNKLFLYAPLAMPGAIKWKCGENEWIKPGTEWDEAGRAQRASDMAHIRDHLQGKTFEDAMNAPLVKRPEGNKGG